MNPKREDINEKLFNVAVHYSGFLVQSLGDDLISVILYGSVARREATPASDIDLMIIADSLPKGQFARKTHLAGADPRIEPELQALRQGGMQSSLSRIVRTPEEAQILVPLYLDLVEDAALLIDRDRFFQKILDCLKKRLKELGARRLTAGRIRYWDLKPDIKPGEGFTL
jgi:predicted nucleotidyltransferase